MPGEKFKLPEGLKKWFDTKMIIILGIVGKMIWDTFQVGAEVAYQQHFQETLKTEGAKNIIGEQISTKMDYALEDKNFLSKAFSAEGIIIEIDKQVDIAKQHIVDEVVAADSSKINLVSGLGVLSGIRDEEVMPLLSRLLKAVDDGDLIFKEDIEDLIEDEVKKRTRTVRADF